MSDIKQVATIEQKHIDDFVNALHPEDWELSAAETRNTALIESRGMVFRFQNTDHPVDATLAISDTENRAKYPEIEPFLEKATSLKYGSELGRVRISCLPPGAKVKPHIDRGRYFEIHNRLMFPLTTNPHCYFWLGGKGPYKPEVGKVYWFNNQKMHRSINKSDQYRMFLMVDVRKS